MTQTNSTPSPADEVRRQMRELRNDLREDVQGIVVSAHQMGDWTVYVRAYPWICVGLAVAAGYLVVPQRAVVVKPDAEGLIELARKNKLVVKMEDTPPQKHRGGLLAQLVSVAAAALIQGGLKFASSQLSQVMSGAAHQSNGRAGVHHE